MSDTVQQPRVPATEAEVREMQQLARGAFRHAIEECSVPNAFARNIQYDRGYLHTGNDIYDLASFSRVQVISIGKAGHTMAQALRTICGEGLSGIIACPEEPPERLPGFHYFLGGHPMPNEQSLRAGDAILKSLESPLPRRLVIYLISGGASAIAEKPISDNINLADLIVIYKALVHSGAPIATINAVRKHLSALKGGRLAAAAGTAHQISVLVSDVPENKLDALASGPTMPDTSTLQDCYDIVHRYNLLPQFPPSVRDLFEHHRLTETPKADDAAFLNARYLTVLSNATAVNAVIEHTALKGFAVEVDNTCDDWDYADAAEYLLRRLRELRRGVSRVCLISGGEVTVKVTGKSGKGGRNQQFALECARKIAGENITILSAGTDGIDGNSPAAGAIVDGTTMKRLRTHGLDASAALASFDAYPLFETLGDAIMTGYTGNNVRDLRILFAY